MTEEEAKCIENENVPYHPRKSSSSNHRSKTEASHQARQQPTTSVERGYMLKDERDTLKEYKEVFAELSTMDGLLWRGSKFVVPELQKQEVVMLAHEEHQGIERSKQFLRTHL